MRIVINLIIAWFCLAFISSTTSLNSDAKAQDQTVDPAAIEALKQMGAHLRTLENFSMTAHTTQDALLPDGQKIQVSGISIYSVRAPDRMKLEVDTDAQHRIYFYDGKSVTQFAPQLNLYAVFDAPGSISETLQHARKLYSVSLPLSDLFYAGANEEAMNKITSAIYVGDTLLDDHWCRHYAYRVPNVDFQVWIRRDGDPLPCEFVTIDRTNPAKPRDAALISFDLDAKFDDQVFMFSPPSGASKIEFDPAKQAASDN